MALNFKCIAEEDAELLLMWRTAPEITKYMFTDLENPSLEKQVAWIKSLSNKKNYKAYIIQDDGLSVGFLCFADIDLINKRCSTGSYIYEREPRLKYGVTLHTYICNYAFHHLNCNKIVNYILGANEKVIKLQQLHKIRLAGHLKQHIYKHGEFHDVHIFEQLKDDWHLQKQHFALEHIRNAFDDWSSL